MKNKEIEQYREQLISIINREKQPNGNPEKNTRRDLEDLAKKVGANTRAILTDATGRLKAYPAGISDLIDNIHKALQTASMINACKAASMSWIVAVISASIAFISAAVAFISAVASVINAFITLHRC